MKILTINGSPHRKGNTAHALDIVEEELRKNALEIQRFEIGTSPVRGCIDCRRCEKTHRCVFNDDKCNEMIDAILSADGVIVASPVYFAGPNGALTALLDRAFYAASSFGNLYRGKPAAALVTVWREGGTAAIDRLNKYFTLSEMPVISSNYWNTLMNGEDALVEESLRQLARNMSAIVKAIN